MSNRTLIELNHDYTPDLTDPAFLVHLGRYLRSADSESAERLADFGARVVGMRHHSDKFIIDSNADGFPPTYLDATGKVQK